MTDTRVLFQAGPQDVLMRLVVVQRGIREDPWLCKVRNNGESIVHNGAVMQDANLIYMKNSVDSPRNTRRRSRLQKLVDANGGLTVVALELKTPKTHLSAVLNGKRGIGDELAARIEKRYALPPGGLDEEEAPELPEVLRVLNGLILRLTSTGRMHIAEIETYVAMLQAREAAAPAVVPPDMQAEATRLIDAAINSPGRMKDLIEGAGDEHAGKKHSKGG